MFTYFLVKGVLTSADYSSSLSFVQFDVELRIAVELKQVLQIQKVELTQMC